MNKMKEKMVVLYIIFACLATFSICQQHLYGDAGYDELYMDELRLNESYFDQFEDSLQQQQRNSRSVRSIGSNVDENFQPFNAACELLGFNGETDTSMKFRSEINDTIWLGAFLPLYNDELKLNGKAVVIFEALRFAIDKINNASALPFGWKFGLRDIVSTSATIEGEVRAIEYFGNCFYSNVLFAISSSETSVTDALDRITESFHIPLISLSSASDVREIEKEINLERNIPYTFDYSYRLSAPDFYRYAALRDLVIKLKWNYISILASNPYMLPVDQFYSMIRDKGICIRFKSLLDEALNEQDPDDLRLLSFLSELSEADKRMKVLILLTGPVDSRRILKALKKLQLEERFLLIFGTTPLDVYVTEGYESVAVGALSLQLSDQENIEFRDHFINLNPTIEQTFYFHQYWEQVFRCNLKSKMLDDNSKRFARANYSRNCDGTERLASDKGYYNTFGVSALFDFMRFLASVINDITDIYSYPCDDIPGYEGSVDGMEWLRKCPWAFISNIRNTLNYHLYRLSNHGRELISLPYSMTISVTNFQHTREGFRNVDVGKWTVDSVDTGSDAAKSIEKFPADFVLDTRVIFLRNSTVGVIPSGICSEKCKAGHIQVDEEDYRTFSCCWECQACPKNNIVLKNKCVSCNFDERPNSNRDTCLALPVRHIELTSAKSLTVIGLSITGLLCVVFIVSVFIRHNDKHVVRASGRDLSYSILAGSALLLFCPFLFVLLKPNPGVCVLRVTLPSLSLLIIFAAILMKYVRLFRIFVRSKTKLSIARPPLISPVSQVLIVSAIAVLQAVLSAGWFLDEYPDRVSALSENGKFVTLRCVADEFRPKMIINCLLAFFTIGCSSFLAYKVRKDLPKNYNESKYIAITSYTTTGSLCLFLPLFILSPSSDNYYHEFLMGFFCITIGFFVIAGLFGSRVMIILCGKPFEECHDSLRSRARSLTPKSPMKCDSNEF